MEYLGTIDDEIADPGLGNQEFAHDDAHPGQPHVHLQRIDHGAEIGWKHDLGEIPAILLAPSVCKSLIFSISVAINPLSTSKMLTMREMASVMMMMALGPAPTQTIKIGPRATLGRAFKMTRYGSDTRERNFDHQSRLAISVPATVPSRKPTTVSKQDMPICGKRSPFAYKLAMVLRIRAGLAHDKGIDPSQVSRQLPKPENSDKNKEYGRNIPPLFRSASAADRAGALLKV